MTTTSVEAFLAQGLAAGTAALAETAYLHNARLSTAWGDIYGRGDIVRHMDRLARLFEGDKAAPLWLVRSDRHAAYCLQSGRDTGGPILAGLMDLAGGRVRRERQIWQASGAGKAVFAAPSCLVGPAVPPAWAGHDPAQLASRLTAPALPSGAADARPVLDALQVLLGAGRQDRAEHVLSAGVQLRTGAAASVSGPQAVGRWLAGLRAGIDQPAFLPEQAFQGTDAATGGPVTAVAWRLVDAGGAPAVRRGVGLFRTDAGVIDEIALVSTMAAEGRS